MADTSPSGTSGGQGGSTGARQALGQPIGAVEMRVIDSIQPSVPAKDGPVVGQHLDQAVFNGKERQLPLPLAHLEQAEPLSIGAADEPRPTTPNPADGPVCNITLLLPTGARHPYKIDDRYLTKRNVDVPDVTEEGKKDPFSVSVYKLKELILREWRDEWDGKPASPSSIRLIHFGKLLEDKEPLNKYRFSAEAPNVVHMSVKPAEMLEEDEAGKAKSGSSGDRNNEGQTGCCVIL